jgi:hypothetical protein
MADMSTGSFTALFVAGILVWFVTVAPMLFF